MEKYENLTLDEERALYGIHDAEVVNCRFEGPADGESALKECGNIRVKNCDFLLRYPFWHVQGGEIEDSRMTDTCRAALWYDSDMKIKNSVLGGIKALRECDRSTLTGCEIVSPEFGWYCRGININDCSLEGEYPFLHTRDLEIENLGEKANTPSSMSKIWSSATRCWIQRTLSGTPKTSLYMIRSSRANIWHGIAKTCASSAARSSVLNRCATAKAWC